MIRSIFVALAIFMSSIATADLRSDLEDSQLSLNVVVERALRDGMSPVQIAVQAIQISPDQSLVIVAALILAAPQDSMSIIQVALDAGVSRTELAATTVIAVSANRVERLLKMIMDGASPGQKKQILASAMDAAPEDRRETIAGLQRELTTDQEGYMLTASYKAGANEGGFSITRRLASAYFSALNAYDAAVLGGDPATIAAAQEVLDNALALFSAAAEPDVWLMSPS